MRQIGTLPDEQDARTFADYVLTLGAKAKVEEEAEGWAVWILDEDHVERAKQELGEFRKAPRDPQYQAAAKAAQDLRRDDLRKAKKARKNVVKVSDRWNRPLAQRCPFTFGSIAFSVLVVAISTYWEDPWRLCDKTEPLLKYLFIVPVHEQGENLYADRGLDAVRRGQVWRLFTPMFIHFGPLHILFNMLWLRELGSAVEYRRGTWRFVLLVLFIAGASNLAQYLYKGPMFGGMSGVVFGLFGYTWMKSRFDPESGFFMPPNTVILMMFFFIICFTGIFPIANTAHTVGLVMGMAIGYASKFWRDLKRA